MENKTRWTLWCRTKACLINRKRVRDFYADMEAHTEETSDVAFDLFGRYGRLKALYKTAGRKCGLGVWGPEFDRGHLLVFDSVELDHVHRRKGYATRLVDAVLDKARCVTGDSFFAICQPGAVAAELYRRDYKWNSAEYRVANDELLTAALRFWRSVGFRRIGSSSYFALTADKNHASYAVRSDKDFDMEGVVNRALFHLDKELA